MTMQRPNTPAPAPVAPLPPRGPGCRGPISRPPGSVPFSMPRSVLFPMPIDTRTLCFGQWSVFRPSRVDRYGASQVPRRAILWLCKRSLTPDDPSAPRLWRRFRCGPRNYKNEGVGIEDFEAQ